MPWFDWLLACGVAVAVLYIPWIFDDMALRVGNPGTVDVVMGSILIVALLEATRRSMGWPLPLIAIAFGAYALTGPVFPGLLKHAGATWSQFVNHRYLTSQGIYGVAVGVVATYVFHFVLFGVLATRIGLGQLFLDVASSVAGRYAGGPAKVSVFGSALFGMLSGSSVANAVTVGSLTIPAMIRVGYKREFAAAVEAASSTGGQITPQVLGAAAFLMIEFLAVPYQTIIAAASVPAFMHFFGVFMQVHFVAKRDGLRGLTPEEMPKLRESFTDRWPTLTPLLLLIWILVSGRTPYLAAFVGISSCAIVGLTTRVKGNTLKNWALMGLLHAALGMLVVGGIESTAVKAGLFGAVLVVTPLLMKLMRVHGRIGGAVLVDALSTGAKYALAAGAAAVGIVIGVVTLHRRGLQAQRHHHRRGRRGGRRRGRLAARHAVRPAGPDPVRGPADDRAGLHPAGLRHPHHGQLHHHGHGGRAHPHAVGRGAAGGALLRLLLRRAGRHHAAGGAGRLCRRRHGRQRPVQDRQRGLQTGSGQGPGALRLRVFTVAADRGQGLHAVQLRHHLHRLHPGHHAAGGGAVAVLSGAHEPG